MEEEKRKELPIMNPAAMSAMAKGDMDNAIIAMTPGGIEAQEAQGQKDFVGSETLPIERDEECTKVLKSKGVKFGTNVDDLFQNVELPKGWKKKESDHSMWSSLVDENGTEIASIFFKAAFYDKSAFMRLA